MSVLSQWYQRRFATGGSRQRRIGIVALARKLLIALWRYVDQAIVPEGARLKVTGGVNRRGRRRVRELGGAPVGCGFTDTVDRRLEGGARVQASRTKSLVVGATRTGTDRSSVGATAPTPGSRQRNGRALRPHARDTRQPDSAAYVGPWLMKGPLRRPRWRCVFDRIINTGGLITARLIGAIAGSFPSSAATVTAVPVAILKMGLEAINCWWLNPRRTGTMVFSRSCACSTSRITWVAFTDLCDASSRKARQPSIARSTCVRYEIPATPSSS